VTEISNSIAGNLRQELRIELALAKGGRDWDAEVAEVDSVQASAAIDSEGAYSEQRSENGDE
jgi:hypothetical protein